MNIDKKYKQKIISLITALQPKSKIYLFGSQATGTQTHGSDIDIAIDTGEKIKRSDVGEIREVLNTTNIPYKIDIVDVNSVSENMKNIILNEGILWKN